MRNAILTTLSLVSLGLLPACDTDDATDVHDLDLATIEAEADLEVLDEPADLDLALAPVDPSAIYNDDAPLDPLEKLPDLVITGPYYALMGNNWNWRAYFVVKNQGSAPAPASTAGVLLMTDGYVADTHGVRTVAVPPLAVGAAAPVQVDFASSYDSPNYKNIGFNTSYYRLRLFADHTKVVEEKREDNNIVNLDLL